MLPSYVVLDLETTGTDPTRDRITEIALIRYEGGHEVARWQTLVNPEQPIPSMIQKLTGISNEMVATAPCFAEVAETLFQYLEGAVLVAHNVRFDYGFLRNAFKRLEVSLRLKTLCTVKLSRLLEPGQYRHSLDAIIDRLGLDCPTRHRAAADVEALAAFLAQARVIWGDVQLAAAVTELLKAPSSLPSGLDAGLLDDLPTGPGVYLFFGSNADLPLYIGKSVNLRARVMSHFSSDHSSSKELRISQEIQRVEWIETAGEFGALLLEARLIKERQPVHNRRLRRERGLCAWRIAGQASAPALVELVRMDGLDTAAFDGVFGVYRSRTQAVEVLRKIAVAHELCPRVLGLESGRGACFAHQLKRCRGACAGKESREVHYARFLAAVAAQRLKTWPYPGSIAIREVNPRTGQTDVHVFDRWCHLGTVHCETEWPQLAARSGPVTAFDVDTYKLLVKELAERQGEILTQAPAPGERGACARDLTSA